MNTHPSQEAIADRIEELYQSGRYDADFRKKLIVNTLTTYAQTIREEERVRIREALNKKYEDNFHWGSGLSEPTHITEKEFGIIVNEALTNKV